MTDVLIVGAGPAGASCALWLTRLGHDAVLADARRSVGGLLNDSPFTNDWIVTQPGVTGLDLAEGIGLSLVAAGVPLLLGHGAHKLERSSAGFLVTLETYDGASRTVTSRFLVIATGVRPRTGGLMPGPRVLVGPGAHVARHDFTGLSVAVLGGGDNAFENHAFVRAKGAREAHIYARTVRAGKAFAGLVEPAAVYVGPYEVDEAAGKVNGRDYDVLLVMYGWEPRPVFEDRVDLARDERGYFRTDQATCETSAPSVYAIGEVAGRAHPCVVTAMADGITAAKAIQRRIESG